MRARANVEGHHALLDARVAASPGAVRLGCPRASVAGSGSGATSRPSLQAGRDPARPLAATRLLVVDPATHALEVALVDALPASLRARDLLVLNDAATLPASLPATVPGAAAALELRIASVQDDVFTVVLFGAGDWRAATEDRRPPPVVEVGTRMAVHRAGALLTLHASVRRVHALSPRLVDITFDRTGAALWEALYALGRPIQYSYLDRELPLGAFQTPWAARPWAVEMPSTGRPLGHAVLDGIRARGVEVATITHAAGLSSTGDPRIDAALPLPERSFVPAATRDAVARARARGGRVVAVGTTVVRALEGAALRGTLEAGERITTLRIDRRHPLRVVDGIVTGVHSPGESHYDLLEAFAPRALLDRAHHCAASAGFLSHELGDLVLILPT